MEHHEFSPSRLEQYRLCPGSYHMQKGIESTPSPWAEEGTRLHKAVETNSTDGLSEEQTGLVEQCRQYIEMLHSEQPGTEIECEQRLDIRDASGDLLTFGTADVIIRDRNILRVIDWKFGYTPVRNVNENIQLATYALGAMQKYGHPQCECYVFQPRLHANSCYTFTNAEAILANIQDIIARARREDLELCPSESACRYCRARLNCPAFRLKFQHLSASKGDYDLANTQTLSDLYEASKTVKTFISEIEFGLRTAIERDGRVGKYILEKSDGAREIKDLNALYSKVSDRLTPQEFNSVCKVTLGKFETLMAEKLSAEAAARGEKLTKTDAKKQGYGLIADLITRGTPVVKIVEA